MNQFEHHHVEEQITLERMRIIEVEDVMPGQASYIFETGMKYALQSRAYPINIMIRSDGGGVFEAINICNALRDIRNAIDAPLIGVVAGNAFSAASYILQQCDLRYAAPTAFLMVHGITTMGIGHDDESIKREQLMMKRLRVIMREQYSKRSTKPATWWDRILQSNTPQFYTAAEALELGLLDEIR